MNSTETAKHTPGPWRIDRNNSWPIYVSAESDGEGVAMMDGLLELREANARLIAAAPELLQALEWMQSLFLPSGAYQEKFQDQLSMALEKAEAVIRKAKGEL